MKNYSIIIRSLWIVAAIWLSGNYVLAQDDLYYVPGKENKKPSVKSTHHADTSGMTDYQRYRAMKEAQFDSAKAPNADSMNL
jgi:hypothetical protein